MLRWVFLDAFGTIIRQEPSFVELIVRACERHRHAVEPRAIARAFKETAPDFHDEACARVFAAPDEEQLRFWYGVYENLFEYLAIRDPALIDDVNATMQQPESFGAYQDVLPAIAELRARGFKIGVISNFDSTLDRVLAHTQISADVVVVSGVEGIAKPDARIYTRALERAGVRAEEAIYVGDSDRLDVAPARAIGLRALLLLRDPHKGQRPPEAIKTLDELLTHEWTLP